MKTIIQAAVLLSLFLLLGCSTTRGPQAIVSAVGAIDLRIGGIAGKFSKSEAASFKNTTDSSMAKVMLEDGFTLVYANCSDFFATAGTTEKWVIFSRDAVAAIGTLGTSILALHDGSKNAVSNLALSTAALFMGLDLYTKDFLFAAENIESVRALVTRALGTHQTAIESIGPMDYQSVLVALSDHQDICSPMNIAALAREAIKKGVVVAEDGVSNLPTSAGLQDEAALRLLGNILNPPSQLSHKQAGALWWLLKESSNAVERSNYIAPLLNDLPVRTSPFTKGPDGSVIYNDSWAERGPVESALGGFSASTKASFKAEIEAFQKNNAATSGNSAPGQGPAPAVLPLAPPSFELSRRRAGVAHGHIGIGIQ